MLSSEQGPPLGRLVIPDTTLPGTSEPPQGPGPPLAWENSQHLRSQVHPEVGAGLGCPENLTRTCPQQALTAGHLQGRGDRGPLGWGLTLEVQGSLSPQRLAIRPPHHLIRGQHPGKALEGQRWTPQAKQVAGHHPPAARAWRVGPRSGVEADAMWRPCQQCGGGATQEGCASLHWLRHPPVRPGHGQPCTVEDMSTQQY